MSRLFCFGAGLSARTLAARLQSKGWTIAGTTRSAEKAASLRAAGIEPHQFDGTRAMAPEGLDRATHVLISAPPDQDGDPVLRHHGPDLAARAGQIAWIGYLSTTGVYGDAAGAWIDEDAPRNAQSDRGQRRVAAEDAWLTLGKTHGLAVQVFRLAGIYGPGRNQLETARAGTARRIDKPGQVFSRIHVEDIATVLEASMARPRAGAAYNVCDDEPAPPGEVVAFACALLGLNPPPVEPFETAQASMSPMARSFYSECKRCRNTRIKDELGVQLAYPTYREGLRGLLATLGTGKP